MTCQLCDKPARSRGLCQTHYSNLMRYNDPKGNPNANKPGPPSDFAGRGVLRCLICDEPYVEHPIRPCDRSGEAVLR